MERDASEHGIEFSRDGLQYLVSPEDEDDVFEELAIQELGGEVAFPDAGPVTEEVQEEDVEYDVLSVEQEIL